MSTEVKIPALGESITEVMVGEFYRREGDFIHADDNLVEIESEKATMDVPSPVSGLIQKILLKQGAMARIGDTLVVIDETAAPPAGSASAKSAPAASKPAASKSDPPPLLGHVMPAAARALSEKKLSPEQVAATGPGGRLLKEDVLKHADRPVAGLPAKAAGAREDEVIPMSMLRRKIAERLVAAQQNAALLTTFNEIDMSAVIELRKQYQEAFQKKYGLKLGFMSFFVKAAIDALKQIPQVNGEIRGHDLIYHNYYDIGIAVGGGKGLVVPIIRDADRLSFAEVEGTINALALRAKEGTLAIEDLQGGTFTISNGGIYGSMLSTPIVNPPQSAILGLHAIQDRAVVVDGQVVARPMMYVALTYDHRIIDGREAVTFLKRIKETIEEPTRMLIEC